jgi:hypothetical protein
MQSAIPGSILWSFFGAFLYFDDFAAEQSEAPEVLAVLGVVLLEVEAVTGINI